MCGIFGTIGVPSSVFRALAVLNESRGTDAFGALCLCGGEEKDKLWKIDEPAATALALWEDDAVEGMRALLGHTRFATTKNRGADNAHPFLYPPIIGAHNGIIDNDHEFGKQGSLFEVDSEAIFWLLQTEGIEGLKKLKGRAACWWISKKDRDALYLWRAGNPLAYHKERGLFVFSSEASHIRAAMGPVKTVEMPGNTLVRLDLNTLKMKQSRLEILPPVVRQVYRAGRDSYMDAHFDWSGYQSHDPYIPIGAQRKPNKALSLPSPKDEEINQGILAGSEEMFVCKWCEEIVLSEDITTNVSAHEGIVPLCPYCQEEGLTTDAELIDWALHKRREGYNWTQCTRED